MSESKSRMLRLRRSSSNSLRVGLTKLNLLVGWMSWSMAVCAGLVELHISHNFLSVGEEAEGLVLREHVPELQDQEARVQISLS